ncbi:MAG: hypothetical protein U5R30_16010 [Deltaproteobacteria bacterium]|nr:hypothetical protein [Deltaproteobacteria bacterium]
MATTMCRRHFLKPLHGAPPISNGALLLGTWQQAVAIDRDNRAPGQKYKITIIGIQTAVLPIHRLDEKAASYDYI